MSELLQEDSEMRLDETSEANTPGSAPEDPAEDILSKFEALYELEFPVRCPSCHERISTIGVVRLARSHVNFISTFPRRGYVAVCTHCTTIVPTALSGLL